MDDTLLVRVKKIAAACRQNTSYNLFSVLGIETKEVLICRVLAADLICISFKEHIIHWLEQCRNVSREEMKPLLTQFIDTIRTITGITRENMTDMTAQEIAGSADSLRAAMHGSRT